MTELARQLENAVEALRRGELVGMPTETVYGLAADARNPEAVLKIFAAKGRPSDHPLIVHIASANLVEDWASDVPPVAKRLAKAFWPGPLTLILKRLPSVPDEVTGGQDTVGLRVPSHPIALALLKAFGGGVAAPSANRFGRISPTRAAHVSEELGEHVAVVLDGGECEVGIESTIIDVSRGAPVLLRPGRITKEEVARVAGEVVLESNEMTAGAPRASGTLASHYAPVTPVSLVSAIELFKAVTQARSSGENFAVLARTLIDDAPPPGSVWRMAPSDPAAYAHRLYASLRWLDQCGTAKIFIEVPPPHAEWRAVNDRLSRAAVFTG
ncbi:L-threonylcarbamoyladenylate synthase [Nitrogeniibacter aestuarii]|uniref:L-threonylcarbamoyladenylate synthase n=1 Tax=Nitrogeniibacter aestuarii TaxID=2815343 RepID=UPI001E2A36F6|nr:L-threonylcarbamoyladenylate synthase [Nitrogeniibacter aestuarii]